MERDYFEDCRAGDQYISPGRTITETDIVMFAGFTGDWNAVHTDKEYAKAGIFEGRVAHGLLTLAVGSGLLSRQGVNPLFPKSAICITGFDRIRFIAPVKIGDTIHLEGEIADMTATSDGKGIIHLKFSIKNHKKKRVVTGRLKLLAACRFAEQK
jgi:acyl dehydratase